MYSCAFCSSYDSKTAIPRLSLGLSLSSPYLAPDRLDSFMRRMLVSRISRRVLAEHHIALSDSLDRKKNDLNPQDHVGVIYTGLNVKDSVDKCAGILRSRPIAIDEELITDGPMNLTSVPKVVVDGHLDTRFAYIREHLE